MTKYSETSSNRILQLSFGRFRELRLTLSRYSYRDAEMLELSMDVPLDESKALVVLDRGDATKLRDALNEWLSEETS